MSQESFTSNTKLHSIYCAKEFKPFRRYLIQPTAFRHAMLVYRLKSIPRFYPIDPQDEADTFNEMRERAKRGSISFHPLDGKAAYFSFLVGEDKPFALIFPGGGYRDVCSFVEGFPVARRLNQLGYNAFIGIYSTGKAARFPAPMDDAAKILKDILDHQEEYGLDPNRYAVMGFSAGGHLAGVMAGLPHGFASYGLPRPKALFLGYTLVSVLEFSRLDKTLFGPHAGSKLKREYSLEENVDPAFPKTYLWQCKTDEVLPFKHSAMMDEALTKAGIPHLYRPVEHGKHGLGLGKHTEADGWLDEAVAFWREN